MPPRLAQANPATARRSFPNGQLGSAPHRGWFLPQQSSKYPLWLQIAAIRCAEPGPDTVLRPRVCHRDSSRGRVLGGNRFHVHGDPVLVWLILLGCWQMLSEEPESREPRSCAPSAPRRRPHEVSRLVLAVAMVLSYEPVCRLGAECSICRVSVEVTPIPWSE